MAHRILCIESDGALRSRIRRLLEADGFAVDEADTGLAGIHRALTLPPDLVLAEVHLPDMDGVEIATRLKQERALTQVPFLALGEAPSEHDVALAAGADAFLAKPLDEAHFAQEVRAVLGGRRERLPEEGERVGLKALSASMASHLEHALEAALGWEGRYYERDRLGRIFIANLAHELRTALTPIAGYLKILASDKLGPTSPSRSASWSRSRARPRASPGWSRTSPTSRASRPRTPPSSSARSTPTRSPTRWSPTCALTSARLGSTSRCRSVAAGQ